MPEKNEIIQLKITTITNEGNGVGRHTDGMTIFVPCSAVGDVVSVRIMKLKKHYAYGKIERIITPSPHRIAADCPVFGKCGGCSLRHISYQEELRIKQDWIQQDLKRIAGAEVELLPILPSPITTRYRNKAQYPLAQLDGQVLFGFYGLRSHRLVPCSDCLLQPESFAKLASAIADYAAAHAIAIYNEEQQQGVLRHVFIRQGVESGQLMLCLVVTSFEGITQPQRLVEHLLQAQPNLTSIVLSHNPQHTNVILGKRFRTIYGSDSICDTLCGVSLDLSPRTFYQVNHSAATLLYTRAREIAGFTGEELLLDLYCGAGSIGLSMAPYVKQLIGVEVVPEAVENARQNAQRMGLSTARFICGDAGKAVQQLRKEGLSPDVVMLDPPRAGCTEETITNVCALQPKKIVMISCNSASAARDCKLLAQKGYHITTAQGVDLFPRTSNVECIFLLQRS